MKKIQMVDLLGQHQKIQKEIDEAIKDTIEVSRFINGPQVSSFQSELEKFLDVDHVIPCGNGTDALQLALMGLDLPKDAEILVPTFNYVASAEASALLGFKPVFTDVDPKTFNITVDDIEKSLTPKTRVIIAVHLYGQSCDMASIMSLAREKDLVVIEDTAQSLGAEYTFTDNRRQKAGTIGHIGTTSFFPTKCLGAMGDGGAVFTNDKTLADKIRKLAFHGQTAKYHYGEVGMNSRLDSMQAAILEVKLRHLPEFIDTRRRIAARYDEKLSLNSNWDTPFRADYSSHVFHQYTLKFKEREKVKQVLHQKEIPFVTYYPGPLHLEKAYQYLGYKKDDFPVSEELSEVALSIPMHTELGDDQIEYITDTLIEIS